MYIYIYTYIYIFIPIYLSLPSPLHLHHQNPQGTEAHRANCAKVKWLRSSPAAEPQAFRKGGEVPNQTTAEKTHREVSCERENSPCFFFGVGVVFFSCLIFWV